MSSSPLVKATQIRLESSRTDRQTGRPRQLRGQDPTGTVVDGSPGEPGGLSSPEHPASAVLKTTARTAVTRTLMEGRIQ